MESLAALYKNHIVTLQERTRDVLARFQMDALLIHSGELVNVFLDDHPYPFKVNPQFKAWVPVTQVPNCWLLVDGVNKPKLWFYLPVDYWHNVEPLPTSFWTEEIDVIALPKADGIGSQLPAARGNIGYIGPVPERAAAPSPREDRHAGFGLWQAAADICRYCRLTSQSGRMGLQFALPGQQTGQPAHAPCGS